MLSDLEREALEILKGFEPIDLVECAIYLQALEKITNLIEKQSKEIERTNEIIIWKQRHEEQLQKEIEELKEKNKFLNWYFENQKDNFVHKDKIKAKIEEVEQWELYNMKIPRLSTLDERLGAKIGIKYVLQSLLEKE